MKASELIKLVKHQQHVIQQLEQRVRDLENRPPVTQILRIPYSGPAWVWPPSLMDSTTRTHYNPLGGIMMLEG